MVNRVLTSALALALLLSTAACTGKSDLVDGISMPASSTDFEGENYQDVLDDLEEAGFTNVETKALGDLIIGWLNKDGSVDEVGVDGESDFSKDTRFERDVEILVSYHSFPPDEEEASDDAEAEPAEPEPEPVAPPAATLDAVTAAQHLAYAWEDRMIYGGTVHWILDRITTANADQTYTFKIGVTLKNAYGTEYHGTIEGDVGGTNDAPIIIDSILYTDAGEIINYYG